MKRLRARRKISLSLQTLSLQTEPAPNRPSRRVRKPNAGEGASAERHQVEGLEGPAELRRAPGGYLQVWPRPSPESLRTLYEENFYEEDKSNYLSDVERDRAFWDATWSMRRTLLEDALPASRRRILDVGCSGGFLLDHFQQHGWTGVGIEPSPRATRWARDHFGLDVFCGELLDYTSDLHDTKDSDSPSRAERIAARPFDAIHSAQVLEHVLDPEACVEHMADLLAPGGVLYVEVPNDFNVFQETARERLDKPTWWVAPSHHLNYFDYESLGGLLARYGLEEIDRLASFPIEMFLLMGEDYIGNPQVGAACHARRMAFERSLIETDRIEDLKNLYRSFARASIGRTCGLLARKRD